MWILPKNSPIYHSAQDMGALILDCNELSELLEQSVLWRSKPTPLKTWQRRLKRGTLTAPLYGQTLKPSLGNCLVREWISSQEGSLVSHLATQAEEEGTATRATCGPIFSEASSSLADLPLFSWRTLQASSAPNSRAHSGQTLRAHLFCCMSSESWRGWATKQRQEYSARLKLVRPTKEKGFSSLPSEQTSSPQDMSLFQVSSDQMSPQQSTLQAEAQSNMDGSPQELFWRTPTANQSGQERNLKTKTGDAWEGDGRAYRIDGSYKSMTLDLQVYAQMNVQAKRAWSTPIAGVKNHESSNIDYYKSRREKNKQIGLQGEVILSQTLQSTFKGRLNPRWVEALMGLPIGWVMSSCTEPLIIEQMNSDCLAMEWCQIQQPEPSESCLIDWPQHKRFGDE